MKGQKEMVGKVVSWLQRSGVCQSTLASLPWRILLFVSVAAS